MIPPPADFAAVIHPLVPQQRWMRDGNSGRSACDELFKSSMRSARTIPGRSNAAV
jgi:hypothetical protein